MSRRAVGFNTPLGVEFFFEMKISEIVKREDPNNGIVLHKEGLFWRAYEFSAFLFVNNIKEYKVMYNYFKNIGQDIVYIGFPNSYYDTIVDLCKQKNYTLQNVNDKQVIIHGISEQFGFEVWKSEIIKQNKEKANSIETDILKKIIDYPLATKTPLEAQQFLFSLQNEINGTL